MKLFVWRGEGVLTDYSNGIMFALAEDAESARKLIAREYAITFAEDQDNPERDMEFAPPELSREPEVFDTPHGFFLSGGG